MGQKVNPVGFRLGYIRESDARWYPGDKRFADIFATDLAIRKFIAKSFPKSAAISGMLIERTGKNVKVTLRSAKPGVIIGKKGEDVDKLKNELSKKIGENVHIGIEEIRKPDLDAILVAEGVAQQLERRIMFRRAMKRAVTSSMRQGAKGIKIVVSGRLGGAEIARSESYREGRVPLHTLRADIDYGTATAKTTYGIIGVKVWIFKGEVIGEKTQEANSVA